MPPPAILVLCIVLADLAVAWTIGWVVVRWGWRPWMADFPPQPTAPDAVRRSFQSFRAGLLNLGFSIHVAADEDFLHLTPLRLWRWIGMGPISIPWSSIVVKKRRLGGRWISATVNGRTLEGPGWCLGLAEAELDSG